MTDSVTPARRRISDSDSAVEAVGKAVEAERVVCDRIIAHYQAVGALAQWCADRSLLDEDSVMVVVRGGFCVGVGGVEPAAPDDLAQVAPVCASLVESVRRSMTERLPAARDRLLNTAGVDALLAKAESVVAERSSVRSTQLIDVQVRAFVAVLASTVFGEVYLSMSSTWWRQFVESPGRPV